ncbi:hypothetical protein D3C79_959900 [compost metagenome]
MNELVGTRTAGEHICIILALSFYQNLYQFAQHLVVADPALFLDQVIQALQALVLNLLRNIILHRGCRRAFARRINKGIRHIITYFADKRQRLFELLLRFTRESDDDIGGQDRVRHADLKLTHQL